METLTAVSPVLVRRQPGAPDPVTLRAALRRWAFAPPRRDDGQPPQIRVALAWIRRNSLPLAALTDDKLVHAVLDVLARKLDGTPAAPDYLGRRRRAFCNALKYAVREKRLTETRSTRPTGKHPDTAVAEINPRVVASPEQVREMLARERGSGTTHRVPPRVAAHTARPRQGGRNMGTIGCCTSAGGRSPLGGAGRRSAPSSQRALTHTIKAVGEPQPPAAGSPWRALGPAASSRRAVWVASSIRRLRVTWCICRRPCSASPSSTAM